MMLVVTKPFVGTLHGHTFNMPAPGTVLDVPDEVGRMLLGMEAAQHMETKVDPTPPELKKNGGLSGLSHLVPLRRLRMLKS